MPRKGLITFLKDRRGRREYRRRQEKMEETNKQWEEMENFCRGLQYKAKESEEAVEKCRQELLECKRQPRQRCGEECRYYNLCQEYKTEEERQRERADQCERAWRAREDLVRQLQEEVKQKDLWKREVQQRSLQKDINLQELSE